LSALPANLILDGELYSDTLTFQEVVGLVKKETLRGDDAEKMKQIFFAVYDIVDTEATNQAREEALRSLFASHTFAHIRPVPTMVCEKRDDLADAHARYVADGYEGLMLRNRSGKYRIGVRSTDLQKYKEFEDAEYEVVGFKEGDGVEKGCVIWVCKTASGQSFAVRPRGTHEERAAILPSANQYIGKQLTVRFQELTNDGVPRFPVGIAFREYE
jgi:DNA ligase-1